MGDCMSGLKKLLKEHKATLGTWITIAHPDVVEILSTLPFDWFIFDMEHAPLDVFTLEFMVMGVRGSDITPIVRVPWNDMVVIKRVLDIGFKGVMVPLVSSREEAELAVKYCLYPPRGVRGVAPRRSTMYGAINFLDYYQRFEREELVIIIQIETEKALRNVEEIANVDGVDVLYVGPLDLSVNLGIPAQFDHPKFIEALEKILDVCKKYDKTPGIHADSIELAKKYISMGFRFITLMSDVNALKSFFVPILTELRKEIQR
jgi:2-keto-3-deoxy-L-rhamnonate aldolase RhmA